MPKIMKLLVKELEELPPIPKLLTPLVKEFEGDVLNQEYMSEEERMAETEEQTQNMMLREVLQTKPTPLKIISLERQASVANKKDVFLTSAMEIKRRIG